MNNIGLICITHDTSGKDLNLLLKLAKTLNDIYSDLFIAVSDETDKILVNELKKSNFNIKVIQKKGVAHARREALEFGLSGANNYFHYCDFDRILTWAYKYSDELKSITEEISKCDYLILGRTERAFNTHPIDWIETEKIANKIFSLELGQYADVTAGSCAFSRKSAELILKHSKDKMTDAEWPMIVHRIGDLTVNYKAVEGLEYIEDINGCTIERSESEKWLGRLRLSYIISESAINTGK